MHARFGRNRQTANILPLLAVRFGRNGQSNGLLHRMLGRFGRNSQPGQCCYRRYGRFSRIGQVRRTENTLSARFGGIEHSSGVFGGTFVDPHIDQRAGHHEYHTNPEWHT